MHPRGNNNKVKHDLIPNHHLAYLSILHSLTKALDKAFHYKSSSNKGNKRNNKQKINERQHVWKREKKRSYNGSCSWHFNSLFVNTLTTLSDKTIRKLIRMNTLSKFLVLPLLHSLARLQSVKCICYCHTILFFLSFRIFLNSFPFLFLCLLHVLIFCVAVSEIEEIKKEECLLCFSSYFFFFFIQYFKIEFRSKPFMYLLHFLLVWWNQIRRLQLFIFTNAEHLVISRFKIKIENLNSFFNKMS